MRPASGGSPVSFTDSSLRSTKALVMLTQLAPDAGFASCLLVGRGRSAEGSQRNAAGMPNLPQQLSTLYTGQENVPLP